MPWLMKAEPDSRIVKGKDVKTISKNLGRFATFVKLKVRVSPWDGVRGHEARNIMRDRMKKEDKVLFYHSNCKVPGVFALAEIHKEGYPDHTAWDPEHPYFDEKTKKETPTWFMVDVKFVKRLPHPPTLALIKHIAACAQLPGAVSYIGDEGFRAIKAMPLINKGRLNDAAYEAVVHLGMKGGWEELAPTKGKAAKQTNGDVESQPKEATPKSKKRKSEPAKPQEVSDEVKEVAPKAKKRKSELVVAGDAKIKKEPAPRSNKRKSEPAAPMEEAEAAPEGRRRSRRSKG